MKTFGVLEFAKIYNDWMQGLAGVWNFMIDTKVGDYPLFSVILGVGVVSVMSFTIAKWIIDFIP